MPTLPAHPADAIDPPSLPRGQSCSLWTIDGESKATKGNNPKFGSGQRLSPLNPVGPFRPSNERDAVLPQDPQSAATPLAPHGETKVHAEARQAGAKQEASKEQADRFTPGYVSMRTLIRSHPNEPHHGAEPPMSVANDPTRSPLNYSPPPLVRHLLLLCEAHRHERQLIPIIAAAVKRHMDSSRHTAPHTQLSQENLVMLLKRDLATAYALIADDIRRQILVFVNDNSDPRDEANAAGWDSAGPLRPKFKLSLKSPIPQKTSAPTVPPFVHNFFSDLQTRVHTSVAWNSSVLVLKHPYIVQAVCGTLGVANHACAIKHGISRLEYPNPISERRAPKAPTPTITLLSAATPLLEASCGGALLPVSAESARLIHNYNAQLLVAKKMQIIRDANATLTGRKFGETGKEHRKTKTPFSVSRAFAPPFGAPEKITKPTSHRHIAKPDKATNTFG